MMVEAQSFYWEKGYKKIQVLQVCVYNNAPRYKYTENCRSMKDKVDGKDGMHEYRSA
jgi:hypothetical protein